MKNRNSYFLPTLAVVLLIAFLAFMTEARAQECAPFGLQMAAEKDAAIRHFEAQDVWTKGDIEPQSGHIVHYYEKWYADEQITQVVGLYFHGGMLSNVLIAFLTDYKPGAQEMIKFYRLAPKKELQSCGGKLSGFKYKGKFPAFVSTRANGTGQLYALEVDGDRLWLHIWFGDASYLLAEASKLES